MTELDTQNPKSTLQSSPGDARRIRMLLVEDNEDDVVFTRRAFTVAAPHVTIDAVTRGGEAIRMAANDSYDVAVVDYILPDMDGVEVLHHIVEHMPVIMVTGLSDQKLAVRTLKSGASDYLVKDEGYLNRLPQAVLGAVGRSRLSKENLRLAAQTARQASLLEAVLNTDPAAVAVFRGPDLRLELANPSFRALIPGFDTLDLIGKAVDEAFGAYREHPLRRALDEVYATGRPFQMQNASFGVGSADGRRDAQHMAQPPPRGHPEAREPATRYFTIHMRSLNTEAADEERGVAVIMWEVTEEVLARQQVEELARRAEAERAWLQSVIDQMPEGVTIFSAGGDVLLSNRTSREMLGEPFSNISGAGLHTSYGIANPDGSAIPADDLPIVRALKRQETIVGREMRIKQADGRLIDILVNCAPLYDSEGKLAAAVAVYQDITPLKDAERLKDEFMSIASHELRTPLTNVKAAAQLMVRRVEAKPEAYLPQDLDYLKSIVQQSTRMARLIEELLDVARLQSGRLMVRPVLFDLATLAKEVVEENRLSRPEFHFELSAQGPVWVQADRDRITQVLGNLLENAVKYSSRQGRVEVRVSAVPDQKLARLEVQDNGIGFEPEQGERIFERFSRLTSIANHSRGMGLGLFISRQIMTAHGGTITAYSAGPGMGATFTVTLPLAESS